MIEYRDSHDGIESRQLTGFFVGWPNPPSPETHLRLLNGSDIVVVAFDTGADRVVGYITALTDGVLMAYISSLEVLPEWQGRGIGSELVRRVLDRLQSLYAIDLLCDDDVLPFYERLGLTRATGALMRRYDYQSGTSRSELASG
ncbi:MAG TPA: GNAT family N-acetyltransferase [Thermomicrobiales bacterium]|nr:GNAT family N-acetyltransferase [Thermomicrobiales bacterium]